MQTGRGSLTRRHFVLGATALGWLAGLQRLTPAYAWTGVGYQAGEAPRTEPGVIDLRIARRTLELAERNAFAITINGSLPGPLVRLREGEDVTLRVANDLDEDTSIHWHGLLVPPDMDGVPGVSFPGIAPGQTFVYRFPVRQNGTYWYHSHSGLQEQSGVYGPLIVDPAAGDPFRYDRDHVVLLSDWTFEDPHDVLANLKKRPGYYNFQRRTVPDFARDVREVGWRATVADRLAWGRMRMDPTDISDVTGTAYTYLMNGLPPAANWTALFRPGERVRLRIINGSAMTNFDLRIPGLQMTVVQADGQNVEPVAVDELRIAVAETFDVLVEPRGEDAFTIFAETTDRSGYARGTLAPRTGLAAPVPERRPRPLRTMADMGMGEASMAGMDMPGAKPAADPHAGMAHGGTAQESPPALHGPDQHGPGNSMVAMAPKSRLHEPGAGLEGTDRRVLVYTDLRALAPGPDPQEPARELELHLTGNMERYMWSFDGEQFSEVTQPVPFQYGERLRLVLVNDTMMEHPIHLHGMWMQLENGAGVFAPRKHTLNVKPGERLSVLVTADALGRWAFHCHLLYHMEMGMFRVVAVVAAEPRP